MKLHKNFYLHPYCAPNKSRARLHSIKVCSISVFMPGATVLFWSSSAWKHRPPVQFTNPVWFEPDGATVQPDLKPRVTDTSWLWVSFFRLCSRCVLARGVTHPEARSSAASSEQVVLPSHWLCSRWLGAPTDWLPADQGRELCCPEVPPSWLQPAHRTRGRY